MVTKTVGRVIFSVMLLPKVIEPISISAIYVATGIKNNGDRAKPKIIESALTAKAVGGAR
jgi:hypothetical protein